MSADEVRKIIANAEAIDDARRKIGFTEILVARQDYIGAANILTTIDSSVVECVRERASLRKMIELIVANGHDDVPEAFATEALRLGLADEAEEIANGRWHLII